MYLSPCARQRGYKRRIDPGPLPPLPINREQITRSHVPHISIEM